MNNKEFLNANLGRIYEHNGLFVEVVGYVNSYPRDRNIVRYLNPDEARKRAKGWTLTDEKDMIAQGYDKPGSVYCYVLQSDLKQVAESDAVQAFAVAYKGNNFDLNGSVVTVVGYSTGNAFAGPEYSAVIVARTQGGWQMVGDADFILFNSEQKTFNYANYSNLKPIRK